MSLKQDGGGVKIVGGKNAVEMTAGDGITRRNREAELSINIVGEILRLEVSSKAVDESMTYSIARY
jgi:hypothetical protein